VLKQPLHTSIAMNTQDLGDFVVEENQHIVISVRDFKAIVMHAGISSVTVSVAYSVPSRPLQIRYSDVGVDCEFILMTIGTYDGDPATSSAVRGNAARKPSSRLSSARPERMAGAMAPPARPLTLRRPREIVPDPAADGLLGTSTTSSMVYNPMFFTEADDDRQWDPTNEEDEEMLGWDAKADEVSIMLSSSALLICRQDGAPWKPSLQSLVDRQSTDQAQHNSHILPTQRLSQVSSEILQARF
jgi:cell cycle checkpoint control protein RAD9A